jgi:hypothetical protein
LPDTAADTAAEPDTQDEIVLQGGQVSFERWVDVASKLLDQEAVVSAGSSQPTFVCPVCGAAMVVVEALLREQLIRAPPPLQGPP